MHLYRVENPQTMVGLWYNAEGQKTDFIKTIGDAQCADIPMDFDPTLAGGWNSACETLAQMRDWFSAQDLAKLSEVGYGLYIFEVQDYRTHMGHAVFHRDSTVSFRPAPIALLDP